MATRLGEHQIAELNDQSTLFRNRNKFGGRDQASGLVAPARQGLNRRRAPRRELEHGLIKDLNLFAPDRLSQFDFKDVALGGFGLELRRVEIETISTGILRLVECKIGVAKNFIDARAMLGHHGDTDAASDHDRVAVYFIGFGNCLDQARGECCGAVLQRGRLRYHDQRELVTADPGRRIDFPGLRLDFDLRLA